MTAERQARLYRDGNVTRMRHLPTQLREVSTVRTVGFQDAVDDLGTHVLCGHEVPYSKAQVRAVLKGEHKSERLLKRILEKRPDLLTLRFVAPEVRAWAKEAGLAERSSAISTGAGRNGPAPREKAERSSAITTGARAGGATREKAGRSSAISTGKEAAK